MDSRSDGQLLAQYVENASSEALCELAERHAPMVRAAALREVTDAHAADDITQAVFLVLMRRAGHLARRGKQISLGGWLFQTTRYVAADWKRRSRRRARHEQEAARMQPSATTGDHFLAAEALSPALNDALGRLGPADRDAIVLRYLEDRSAAEIAEALAVTENTARQRVARALARLRKLLARRGITASAIALAAALEGHRAAAQPLATTLQSLLQGAPPATSVDLLSHGAMHMMRHAHRMFVGTVTATAIAAAAAGFALAAALHPPAPAAVAATAPAHGPRDTPKGTVQSAYEAAIAGDADGLIKCFTDLNDEQRTVLRQVTEFMTAFNNFRTAAVARFGPDALKTLPDPTAIGTTDIQKADEKIDGDRSTIDLHGAGPGMLTLQKGGKSWRIDAASLDTLNRNGLAQLHAMVPTLDRLTGDVKAGKYATLNDLQAALTPLMTPPK